MPHCITIGAGPGLGLALARRFADEGYTVSLIARRESALKRYQARLAPRDVHVFAADAADAAELGAAIRAAEAKAGPCDVLCYNPAARIQAPMAEVAPEDLVDTFRVNVAGALAAVRAVLPGMRKRGRGTVLLTGGGLAIRPMVGFGALAIGKAGLRSLAHSLHAELKEDGIYVGTVLVAGFVQQDTHFDPDTIAGEFWRLHAERPGEFEVLFR